MALTRIFGKTVAVIFMVAHGYFFFQSLIYSLGFMNHFSNAAELENGLGGILHAILHAGCFYLGLCLYYGIRESDRNLLMNFLVPATVLTVLSLLYLLVVGVFYSITILQGISWSLHIMFYSIVIFVVSTVWSSIPSGTLQGPSDDRRSPEDGMVQEVQPTPNAKDALFSHLLKDWASLVAWAVEKFNGFLGAGSTSKPKSSKGKDKPDGLPGDDYVYDSDNSDSD